MAFPLCMHQGDYSAFDVRRLMIGLGPTFSYRILTARRAYCPAWNCSLEPLLEMTRPPSPITFCVLL